MSALDLEEREGAVRFSVRVSPRASKVAIGGVHGGALKVKVTAPPVDGAANAAVIAAIAKRLGVPKRAVQIVSGESSRDKRLEVRGVDVLAIRALA